MLRKRGAGTPERIQLNHTAKLSQQIKYIRIIEIFFFCWTISVSFTHYSISNANIELRCYVVVEELKKFYTKKLIIIFANQKKKRKEMN